MSYDKAMKHSRNVRKTRKQANNYMGFDTGTGRWPNPRRNPEVAAMIEVRDWFRQRHFGDKAYNRECIAQAIETLRAVRAAQSSELADA